MFKVVKEREICECCGNTKNHEVKEYFCDFCNELINVEDKSKTQSARKQASEANCYKIVGLENSARLARISYFLKD